MIDNTKENIKLDGISITILIISVIVIVFSFFAPAIFVQESINGLNFKETGPIGDTIGGIMNPFIAISGVLLTFLAFFIQFKANKLQRDLFRVELNEQKKQFQKTQFENQFYEMLKLHKENINELEITTFKSYEDRGLIIISGRRVFELLIKEFEFCYSIIKKISQNQDFNEIINKAYSIFFSGFNKDDSSLKEHSKLILESQEWYRWTRFRSFGDLTKEVLGEKLDYDLNHQLFQGYSSQLAHYYRHLFQTVKFIVYQEESLVPYEDKRKYLRILRAQLSNQEQAMLFYNWLSDFGRQWENDTNKFFYRLQNDSQHLPRSVDT